MLWGKVKRRVLEGGTGVTTCEAGAVWKNLLIFQNGTDSSNLYHISDLLLTFPSTSLTRETSDISGYGTMVGGRGGEQGSMKICKLHSLPVCAVGNAQVLVRKIWSLCVCMQNLRPAWEPERKYEAGIPVSSSRTKA